MTDATRPVPPTWSRKKRDPAPRGVCRHPSSTAKQTIWAIRFTCGAGHLHKEKIGPIKSAAVSAYHDRRGRARHAPGWCPQQERHAERARAHTDAERAARRLTFRQYADDYLAWARAHKRGWMNERTILTRATAAFGARWLDAITTADVEVFRDGLLAQVSRSTANRYRDGLSGMFRRAIRLGLIEANPVTGVPKFKESKGRVVYLTAEEEAAVRDALPPALRALFEVSVYTGLRYSEQMRLRWRDVDMLAGIITVLQAKNGETRQVPINSVVRDVLLDLGSRRSPRLDDAEAPVFPLRPRDSSRFFPAAVERAQEALRQAGTDASRLDGYTWHGNRHTFASRLVMAKVDLRSVQELGGWKSYAMVQRYSHLSPDHLQAAVERLVPGRVAGGRNGGVAGSSGAVELSRIYPDEATPQSAPAPIQP